MNKEINEYRHFTTPAELHKAVNTLHGILSGIQADEVINSAEIEELSNWCILHENLSSKHPFNEILPIAKDVFKSGTLSEEIKSDLLWLCDNFSEENRFYDEVTSSIQYLSGLIHGIMADEKLLDSEILALKDWLVKHDYLHGTYPFDEIESLIVAVLDDGKISDDEKNMLKAFFSNFIDLSNSYNLNESKLNALKEKYCIDGICGMYQEIDFYGKVFAFTGQSVKCKRTEIQHQIETLGGIFKGSISGKTDYLIVGAAGNPCWAYSCYGRKIEEAMQIRRAGGKIKIINEIDFWDIVEDL
ncbi:MAG: BRCT domain-containing protein [Anaerovoracaceae bacterium]|uniref:BRCT domain-containing protein n=1 Tax=Chryseobacterium sp. TaxID=1871047 RepID=UPI002FC6B523